MILWTERKRHLTQMKQIKIKYGQQISMQQHKTEQFSIKETYFHPMWSNHNFKFHF